MKNNRERKQNVCVVIVAAFLLAASAIGLANAFMPDLDETYDTSRWEVVVEGTGGVIFPDEWSPDYLFGDTVAPAYPNARIMTENTTSGLQVVFAQANPVGVGDTSIGIVLATSPDLGITWAYETIVEGAAGFMYGLPTMDIDSNDFLHIAYIAFDRVNNISHIEYVNNTGGDWTNIISLEQADWNQTYPALQVNSSDVAYVVWQSIDTTHGVSTLFGWSNNRLANDIIYVLGDDWPVSPEPFDGFHFKYPSIAIAQNDSLLVSYHGVDHTTEVHRVGVSLFTPLIGYVGSYKAVAHTQQARNANIALNETDCVVLTYKWYDTVANTSGVMLSIQNETADLSAWNNTVLSTYDYHGVWIYPSVSALNTEEYIVTSMVVDTRTATQRGMFYANLTEDGETAVGYIAPPHDYVLYVFAHQKWSSHNRNGQNFGDCTLWIIELDFAEDYVATTIVAMGWGLGIGGGSYTSPPDPTPPTITPGVFADAVSILAGLLPVIVIFGILLLLFSAVFGGEMLGKTKNRKE